MDLAARDAHKEGKNRKGISPVQRGKKWKVNRELKKHEAFFFHCLLFFNLSSQPVLTANELLHAHRPSVSVRPFIQK